MSIVYALIFVLAPAGVMWLCRRYRWLGKIGPVLVLYILGIILGNLGIIPGGVGKFLHPEGLAKVQDLLSSAMVPLAIPLLLYGCTFRKSETRGQLLALLTGIVAVILAVVAGYLIFGKTINSGGEDAAKIGGMLTGVYTGGTINLAALKTMLGVREETYILLNSYDMVISFLYLTFLMAIGIKLFRKILPGNYFEEKVNADIEQDKGWKDENIWRKVGMLAAATVIVVGVSAGVALLMPDGWFMTAFILLLTTLGIAASRIRRLREIRIAEDIAMYCIYIFSIVVASMADLKALDLGGSLGILGYLTLVIFGSLILQVIFARIFKIDADTIVIASTAFICSPPFVPMMAATMKNKRIIVAGLSIGIIGYAAGNYLGFLISKLLPLL